MHLRRPAQMPLALGALLGEDVSQERAAALDTASALRAEALSKSAVIAGSVKGFALLDRAHVRGAVLLTSSGAVLALPDTLRLLAD